MKRYLAVLLAPCLSLAVLPAADEMPDLKPVPLIVNTDKDEDEPHLSSDGLRLYYMVNTGKKTEIWQAERKKTTAPFGPGKPVEDLKSKNADARSVFVTPEGKYPQKLYFASNHDPERKSNKGDNFDIWFVSKQLPTSDWTTESAIVNIGTEHDEMHPWLTPDDSKIYFSRKEKEGWHQYVSARPADGGPFGQPVSVGLPLNFHHATLTPDGKTMYVQGPLEEKDDKVVRWGLFRSTFSNKAWSKPEPLKTINGSEGNTVSPNLSRDGKELCFASDRPGGKGGLDLYVVSLVPPKKK